MVPNENRFPLGPIGFQSVSITFFEVIALAERNDGSDFTREMFDSPLGSTVEFRFGPPSCEFEWKWITNGIESGDPKGIGDLILGSRLLVMKSSDTSWLYGYRIDDRRTKGLYRDFGALEPTEEAILDFANRFGPLGTETYSVGESEVTQSQMRIDGPSWPTPNYAWNEYRGKLGENLEDWKARISEMHAVLDLSAALGSGKIGDLRKWIRITNRTIKLRHPSFVRSIPVYRTKEDEYSNAARRLITQITNDILVVTTALAFSRNSKGDRELEVEYRTTTLLGAIWIQFLDQTIAGGFKRCKFCGTVFPVGSEGKRSHAKYCSRRCNLRAFRAKAGN